MKQHETAEDLVCQIEYLYHQSRYLNPAYRRLLCNALIQPHFDYGCSSWFPLLKKYLKFKLQKASNFKLQIYSFLPKFTCKISYRSIALKKNKLASGYCKVENCIAHVVFKHWNGIVPGYVFMKCLNLHFEDIAQDHRLHWTYLCGKQMQGKKAYPS